MCPSQHRMSTSCCDLRSFSIFCGHDRVKDEFWLVLPLTEEKLNAGHTAQGGSQVPGKSSLEKSGSCPELERAGQNCDLLHESLSAASLKISDHRMIVNKFNVLNA